MSKLIINGGKSLRGECCIQGAKNSALPILAACIMAQGECVIHNCPNLADTDAAGEILETLGCSVKRQQSSLLVNSRGFESFEIPEHLMRKMRSSIMFLGAILAKAKKAKISLPGGCELGPRPIDLHISALSRLGVEFKDEYGFLMCECPNGLNGSDIILAFPSVGATENVMLAATCAKGQTVIRNAAKEPEIEDLQNFLNDMGADVNGAGSDMIVINGKEKLYGAHHSVIPDRIVAATYIMSSYITGGSGVFHNLNPRHLQSIMSILSDSGAAYRNGKDFLELYPSLRPKAIKNIRTMPYPGFPTDAQAPLMALMTTAQGSSMFVETIFDNRYKHVGELRRMGAKIDVEGRVAIVDGIERLSATTVMATDLRGGAALVIAALAANGKTEIENIFHIDRGYDTIEEILSNMGADIKRVE